MEGNGKELEEQPKEETELLGAFKTFLDTLHKGYVPKQYYDAFVRLHGTSRLSLRQMARSRALETTAAALGRPSEKALAAFKAFLHAGATAPTAASSAAATHAHGAAAGASEVYAGAGAPAASVPEEEEEGEKEEQEREAGEEEKEEEEEEEEEEEVEEEDEESANLDEEEKAPKVAKKPAAALEVSPLVKRPNFPWDFFNNLTSEELCEFHALLVRPQDPTFSSIKQHLATTEEDVVASCTRIKEWCESSEQDLQTYSKMGEPSDNDQQTARNNLRAKLKSEAEKVMVELDRVVQAAPNRSELDQLESQLAQANKAVEVVKKAREDLHKAVCALREEADAGQLRVMNHLAGLLPSLSAFSNFVSVTDQQVRGETTLRLTATRRQMDDLAEQERQRVAANMPPSSRITQDIESCHEDAQRAKEEREEQTTFHQRWRNLLSCLPRAAVEEPVERNSRKRSWREMMFGGVFGR